LTMNANGFNGQLTFDTNTLAISSGPLAMNAGSTQTGGITMRNSYVTVVSDFGQTWSADNTVANGQANIFVGATQAHNQASLTLSISGDVRLQSAGRMEVTANAVQGAPLTLSAGNSILVYQTGTLTGTQPGIEFATAYGDIQVLTGQSYTSSLTGINLSALQAINFNLGTTLTFNGGMTTFNARQGDLNINAGTSIVFQATTQRISTSFQETGSAMTINAPQVVIDMIDLLAILSDVTLESNTGSITFSNDVYALGSLSIPINNELDNIRGAACTVARELVITTSLGVVPRLCVCQPTTFVWRCSTSP